MSSDSTKENASVVDSSVTEWKHDMGNPDDPESPSYKHNDYGGPCKARKTGHDRLGNSSINENPESCNSRYFIIKSLNHHNIQLSIEKGIWATQVMNEPILEEAFHNAGKVILIFSVNMSGFFQGYAQMMSSVGWRHDSIWSQGNGKNNPWGRSFKVKWLRLNDLSFQKTLHLKNPMNDNKPVKISRDCQELPEDIGEALCELIDGKNGVDGIRKRDGYPSKRPCMEPPCSLGNGEHNAPMLHVPWARTPIQYPPFLYQHNAEMSRFHLGLQGLTDVTFPETLPLTSGSSKVSRMKHSRANGNLTNFQVHCDVSSQIDVWGLSAESPVTSTLSDDDLLEMTYEEYLEVHSRSIKQLNVPASGASPTSQESSRTKKSNDDLNSSFVADHGRPRKSTHYSSER